MLQTTTTTAAGDDAFWARSQSPGSFLICVHCCTAVRSRLVGRMLQTTSFQVGKDFARMALYSLQCCIFNSAVPLMLQVNLILLEYLHV